MMNFRIADTFTDSLARLTGEEQKAVKTTAFDLQMNPASPGMSFHRLDRAKDSNFWSIRVNQDIRIIVHRSAASLLLCYVDHHDKAYQWAERRKLETHPTTGAAQLVEIRERVLEIPVPHYVDVSAPARRSSALFSEISDEELLGYGVPLEWLADVRVADEDTLLELTDHLPGEAAEALLELATGGSPISPQLGFTGNDPFAHPDAQRRFRVVADVEELERAFAYPWEKWTIFLHPAQRQWVERDYNGPARISGSAGTGKTIVALHRAAHLARANPDGRVLLTTFSNTLAQALEAKLFRLVSNQPKLAERIDVASMAGVGERLYEKRFGRPTIVSSQELTDLISESARAAGTRFTNAFLLSEWWNVVDAWCLKSWEEYRDVLRIGRKTRLSEPQRAELWSIFNSVQERLKLGGKITRAQLFNRLTEAMSERRHPPYDFVVVDEAQDISISQLRFLSVLADGRANALFFAGDLGQRIFQQPFSWKALGVDIRGRSRTLKINYRTSHQIRTQADRLLSTEVADVDGNVEVRLGTVSVFNGPAPIVRVFDSSGGECKGVAEWLGSRAAEGVSPHEIGVFVRSETEIDRAVAAVSSAGLPMKVLGDQVIATEGFVSVSPMHLAKGLEFRCVAVMACDDEIIPSQRRMESVTDPADLEEIYNTERHLLYVACTRARDSLHISAVRPVSEFIEDLMVSD